MNAASVAVPIAALIAVLASPPAAVAPAPPPARRPRPPRATEDTMHTEVPEVLVRAPRVTLDEILARVARGEARRDSMLQDEAFTTTVRVVRNVMDAKKGPELIEETIYRSYHKRPDRARTVRLRHWKAKPDKGGKVEVESGSGMDEEIVNFAFRPSARREFRYRIVGRDLLGNHLVYRIAFEPRSALDPTIPNGIVWIDTNEFVIVRQEIGFPRSPIPLILKDIPRMVVERQRVDGYWVLKRVLLRGEFTLPLPVLGRTFDLSIQFDDYAINRGIDDAIFEAKGAAR
jgi:hypothetical protein